MLKKVLLAGLVVFYGFNFTLASASTLEIDTPNCQESCSEAVKIGESYLLVIRDETGRIFKVESLNLSSNAIYLGESIAEVGMTIMSANSDGGYVRDRTDHYETATERISITTHFHYNAAGELIDVQVTEVRFKKTPGDTQIEK